MCWRHCFWPQSYQGVHILQDKNAVSSTPRRRNMGVSIRPGCYHTDPDSEVYGANMGPTWGRQDPGGPHIGPMNFAIWGVLSYYTRLSFVRFPPYTSDFASKLVVVVAKNADSWSTSDGGPCFFLSESIFKWGAVTWQGWEGTRMAAPTMATRRHTIPDNKAHRANMGPIWGRQDPGGPHVGPMNFVIWDILWLYIHISCVCVLQQLS